MLTYHHNGLEPHLWTDGDITAGSIPVRVAEAFPLLNVAVHAEEATPTEEDVRPCCWPTGTCATHIGGDHHTQHCRTKRYSRQAQAVQHPATTAQALPKPGVTRRPAGWASWLVQGEARALPSTHSTSLYCLLRKMQGEGFTFTTRQESVRVQRDL